MKYESVKINVSGAVNAKLDLYIQEGYMEVYGDRKRPLVIICPGGGYEHVSVREGEPVALQFLAAGFSAAVLWYDVNVEYPLALTELAYAVSYIRKNADLYSIDKNKIIVAGFSAGAHLAACLGCLWNEGWLADALGEEESRHEPNGLILSYPVITSGAYAHRGSFEKLMGSKASDELAAKLSLENQVTDSVPPVFMWHTFEDGAVPLENSLLFASALRRAGVSLEYHVFPHGRHGLSLATKETCSVDKNTIEPQCEQWMELCINWIKYNFD